MLSRSIRFGISGVIALMMLSVSSSYAHDGEHHDYESRSSNSAVRVDEVEVLDKAYGAQAQEARIDGQMVAPILTRSDGSFHFINALGTPSAGVEAGEGISLTTSGGVRTLVPKGVLSTASVVVGRGSPSVLYRGAFESTDMMLVPTAAGIAVLIHRVGPDAPKRFAWTYPKELLPSRSGDAIMLTDEASGKDAAATLTEGTAIDSALDLERGFQLASSEFEKARHAIEGDSNDSLLLSLMDDRNGGKRASTLDVSAGSFVLETGESEWSGFTVDAPWSWNEPWREVPGQGPTRSDGRGNYRVLLPNGNVVYTHGADTRETLLSAVPGSTPVDGEPYPYTWKDPVCSTGKRLTLLYGWKNSDNLTTALKNRIRDVARKMTGRIWSEDQSAGGPGARLKVQCSDTNQIAVWKFRAASGNDFASILAAAQAAGYTNSSSKYLIFWDANISNLGYAGQGSLYQDETKSTSNINNAGLTSSVYKTGYAMVYNNGDREWNWGLSSYSNGALAPLHEVMHTMGAVQNGAPASSGAGHCWVTMDVMCYDDGGPKMQPLRLDCPNYQRLDCGKGKYYHPSPPSSNWLYSRWNIGQSENQFMTRP